MQFDKKKLIKKFQSLYHLFSFQMMDLTISNHMIFVLLRMRENIPPFDITTTKARNKRGEMILHCRNSCMTLHNFYVTYSITTNV